MNTSHDVQISDRTACIHASMQRAESETCDGIIFRILFLLSSIMHACLDHLQREHNNDNSSPPLPIHSTVFEQASNQSQLILNALRRPWIVLPQVGNLDGRRFLQTLDTRVSSLAARSPPFLLLSTSEGVYQAGRLDRRWTVHLNTIM